MSSLNSLRNLAFEWAKEPYVPRTYDPDVHAHFKRHYALISKSAAKGNKFQYVADFSNMQVIYNLLNSINNCKKDEAEQLILHSPLIENLQIVFLLFLIDLYYSICAHYLRGQRQLH